MSEELRLKILSNLRDLDKSGLADMKEAAELVKELDQEADQVLTELKLLEDKALVELHEAFGRSYSAIITHRGLDYLKQIEEEARR